MALLLSFLLAFMMIPMNYVKAEGEGEANQEEGATKISLTINITPDEQRGALSITSVKEKSEDSAQGDEITPVDGKYSLTKDQTYVITLLAQPMEGYQCKDSGDWARTGDSYTREYTAQGDGDATINVDGGDFFEIKPESPTNVEISVKNDNESDTENLWGTVKYELESDSAQVGTLDSSNKQATVQMVSTQGISLSIRPQVGKYLKGIIYDDNKQVTFDLSKISADDKNPTYTYSYEYTLDKSSSNHKIQVEFGELSADDSKPMEEFTNVKSVLNNGNEYIASSEGGLKFSLNGYKLAVAKNQGFKEEAIVSPVNSKIEVENVYAYNTSASAFADVVKVYSYNKTLTVDAKGPQLNITTPIANKDSERIIYFRGVDSNEQATVEFTVSDNESGIKEVRVTKTDRDNPENSTTEKIETSESGYVISSSSCYTNGDTEFVFSAVDNVGNTSRKQKVIVRMDQDAPKMSDVSVAGNDGKDALHTIKQGELGYFTKNAMVNIAASVKDVDEAGVQGSGVKEIILENNGAEISRWSADSVNCSANAKYDSEKVTFSKIDLTKATVNNIKIITIDNKGNTETYNLINEEADKNILTYDAKAPSFEVKFQNAAKLYQSEGTSKFYFKNKDTLSDDFCISYNVEDNQAIKAAKCVVGSKDVLEEKNIEGQKVVSGKINKDEFFDMLGTTQIGTMTVSVQDVAGNAEYQHEYVFIKDDSKPEVSNVLVDSTSVRLDGKNSFEFFAKKKSAETSINCVDNENGSGINSVTYTILDENREAIENGNVATFTLKAEFKGYIKVQVVDNVGNETTVITNGIVITNKNDSKTTLSVPASQVKDSNNNKLFGKNTTLSLNVTNSFSGIQNVKYTVTAPYDKDNNIKSITVNGKSKGWDVTKDSTGLVTGISGKINVKNNSNDIVVKATVTDMAGQTHTVKRTVSVDKTKPVISVSYDNNDSDSANCYKAARVATIVVKERNFKSEDFKATITNTNGKVPSLSKWETVKNEENPDETQHIATLAFEADGDYTLDMSYVDKAGNSAKKFDMQTFTIDKNAPQIGVSFDNNNVSNEKYYASGRTATITINEHYFDASRVTVNGIATQDGNTIAFPGLSGWSADGDVHKATIQFTGDGDYSFTVKAVDQAGNESQEYEVGNFVIDQTSPTITFGGVEDQASYNGTVEPTVTFEDVNYDINNVNVTLVGANAGEVSFANGAGDSNNGQTISFSDFAHEEDVDDIYTLTASITDMAGNQFEDNITFSVNRFGSNYVFDKSLEDIEGSYIQKPVDVVFTETNVNTLTEASSTIVVSTNGNPKTLTRGEDYEVATSGGGGSWSQYTYTINKDVFKTDGTYIVSAHSEDTAGNVNENDAEGKNAEITFGVDGTNPEIILANIEDNASYDSTNYQAVVNVSDNLVLSDVNITLDGKKVSPKVDGESYRFDIPENKDKQMIAVSATDVAGNSVVQEASVLVTTNMIARFLNNTTAVVGTVAGVVGVGGGIAVFFIYRKKFKLKAK